MRKIMSHVLAALLVTTILTVIVSVLVASVLFGSQFMIRLMEESSIPYPRTMAFIAMVFGGSFFWFMSALILSKWETSDD